MSLRDDFLEALRSVKRDFFREPEYTEPNASEDNIRHSAPDELDAADMMDLKEFFSPHSGEEDGVYAGEPASGEPEEEDGEHPPAQPDNVVFEAFRQASALEGGEGGAYGAGLHTDEADGQYADAGEEYASTTPFREFDADAAVYGGEGNDGGGGRYALDFDEGNVYSDEKTIISKNTVIRGALQTQDSIRLLGQVLGDIECKSNIVVAGKVRGNTTAANAYIFDAQVDGDVRCDDVINVSNDAWVLGNIRAQQAEINGKIKGNIEIRHAVSIGANSSILGDISTDELEIKRGAFINGQVMMYSPSRDVLDRFDQFKD